MEEMAAANKEVQPVWSDCIWGELPMVSRWHRIMTFLIKLLGSV
jgi:hypothetical protein